MSEPFSFEGDEVTDFAAQLPAITVPTEDAYQRGTLLTLKVQVRVRSVRIEEDRKGNLSRKHVLVLEDAAIIDVLTPAQRAALLEAAEAQARAEAAMENFTVVEEPTFEPIDDTVHVSGQEAVPVEPEAGPETDDQPDPPEPPAAETAAVYEFVVSKAVEPDDDDDTEHDWMDEETPDALRVVGF
jgi:hypothetical protein